MRASGPRATAGDLRLSTVSDPPRGARWFFALWPDAAARDSIARAAAPLIPRGARATHPLDLHLTLRFLGPLSDTDLAAAERTADALNAGPVPVRIDRIGHFARARVLWCGPAAPGPGLLELAGRLEQALGHQGFAPETRPFRPHITLARKVPPGPHLAAARWGEAIDWTAGELILAAGLEREAPRYGARRRWCLRQSGCRPGDAA